MRTQDIPASRPCLGPYFVSSATSTSAGAVMGALECPAVGSSAFSSPLVELSACGGRGGESCRPRLTPPPPYTHTLWCGPWPGTHLVFAVEQGFLSNLRLRGQVRVSRADGRGLQGSQRQLRLSWGPLPATLTCQGPLPCQPPSLHVPGASRPSRTRSQTRSRCGQRDR